MLAMFEIKNIKEQWKPPFKKDITIEEVKVNKGDMFGELERFGRNSQNMPEFGFKLLELRDGAALVEYDYELTRKGYENPKSKQIWIKQDSPECFAYLWGEDGCTKKITYKGQC